MKFNNLESKSYRRKKILKKILGILAITTIILFLFRLEVTYYGRDRENKNIDIVDITMYTAFTKSWLNLHLEF